MACKTDDNGIKSTKIVSGSPDTLKPSNINIIILYATLDSVMEHIKREREAIYYKEVIIYYNNNNHIVPSRIVTVDTKGNEKTQYFLSTNENPHKLSGLTFMNILLLDGYFDNTKLNYIFSRLRYTENPTGNKIPPKFDDEPVISDKPYVAPNLGNDIANTIPSFMDYPITSCFLLGGLLLWIGYLIKGVM